LVHENELYKCFLRGLSSERELLLPRIAMDIIWLMSILILPQKTIEKELPPL
jgi:hypothetical protein